MNGGAVPTQGLGLGLGLLRALGDALLHFPESWFFCCKTGVILSALPGVD